MRMISTLASLVRLVRSLFSDWRYGTALVQVGYLTAVRYKARQSRTTGKIQIWCREWLPTNPDHQTTFTPND